MENQKQSCKERISTELRGRLCEIIKASKSEKKKEEFKEQILAIDKKVVYTVELSCGGPQDFFEISVDPKSHEIISISYHFLDWFDRAELELAGEDFEIAANFFKEILCLNEEF